MRKNTRQSRLDSLLNDNDPFARFDNNFDKNAKKGVAGIAAGGCLLVLVNIVISLALLAGAVWVVVKVLQHLGVI